MTSEETTPSAHAAGTSDNVFSRENSVPAISYKDVAVSLDNINGNMGSMGSLLAQLSNQPNTDLRPPGSKRKSTSDASDISDS